MSTKGDETRQQILDAAMVEASTVGLEGLSIGALASTAGMSKSGLYAHFGSKETLQIAIIQSAADRFADEVIRPAIGEKRGLPRVEALFERWVSWVAADGLPGGCVFMSAAVEFDDRPGPVREAIADTQRRLLKTLERAASIAVEEEHFRADLDCELFAFAAYSFALGAHHYYRLLDVSNATDYARRSFEVLLSTARS